MTRNELDEPRGGLPRSYLRAGLLLLIAKAPTHGYDLLEQMDELGLRIADPGGLYRALRSLERDGYVVSTWEHSNAGPARRVYSLSQDGADWLHAWAGAIRESHGYLTRYLDRYDEMIGKPKSRASSGRRRATPR